jgi:anti-sigma factor RsiW
MNRLTKGLADMDCKQAISLIHDYLDENLPAMDVASLEQHLSQCTDCRNRLKRLELTEAMVRSLAEPPVPDDLSERIMRSLPKRKRNAGVGWIKRHPGLAVASVFLVIMAASFFTYWEQDGELVVKGSNLDAQGIVIEGNKVVVPEGSKVVGDLTVENGEMQVYGEVQGNVTVIDGTLYQASTANISGQVTSINQAIDWIWYKLGAIYSSIAK